MCKTSVHLASCLLLLAGAGVTWGDLTGHWKFNEGAGNTAGDSSGQGHHGQILGAPQWDVGPTDLGGALGFGPGKCVGVDCGAFDPTNGKGQFTVAFWAFWNGSGTFQHFLTKSNGWGATTMMFQVELWGAHTDAGYRDRVGISYDPAGSVAFSLMPKNQWVHLAFVFDGTRLRLFLNGVDEVGPKPFSIGPNVNAPVLIGVDYNGGRVFEGRLDDVRIYDQALPDAQIPKIMKGQFGVAANGRPANGETDVPSDVALSWAPGEFAATHDVYLGTVFTDVNDADRGNPADTLVSQGQTTTTFEPASLEYGRTYYWRIDEVNAAPDSTIFKGDVWSFTVEPYAYPMENIKATASSAQTGMGPQNTVNGSGLNAADQHATDEKLMWLSTNQKPHWIQYEFDKIYKLHELWVWNSNQLIEGFIGFGARNVTVEHSLDAVAWTPLENVPEFARASGAATYTTNTTVAFGGVSAKFVRLTINSNWGGVAAQTGLSEVRFFHVPLQAFGPTPAHGAAGVALDAEFNWRPGREATSHKVFFGTDRNAVAAGAVAAQTVTEHTYAPAGMALGATYFWKVDEVGETGVHEGEVWSFTTQEYAAIDDFEAYNDDDQRIYNAWIDGVTTGASGSQVGYDVSPFAERTIVHGGTQAMPLQYDNTASPFYSEARRTFSKPQDWTLAGGDTLTLYVRGVVETAGNSADGLYVTVEDSSGKSKTVVNPDAGAAAATAWRQWKIPLSEFTSAGVKTTAVKALTIGVGNRTAPSAGGAGIVYVDDIGYGRPLP